MADNQTLDNGELDFNARSTQLSDNSQLQHVRITKPNGSNQDEDIDFATNAKLELVRLLLNSINDKTINTNAISGVVSVDNFPSSTTVNTISGFATSSKQDLAQTTLDLIKAEVSSIKSSYTEVLYSNISTSVTTPIALNANRKGGVIINLSDVDIYINETNEANFSLAYTSNFYPIYSGQSYTVRTTNAIRVFSASGSSKKIRFLSW